MCSLVALKEHDKSANSAICTLFQKILFQSTGAVAVLTGPNSGGGTKNLEIFTYMSLF